MKLGNFQNIFKKQTGNLPFKYYYIIIITITIAGLANAIYLSVSHYRIYTDIGYQSFCALSRLINCDTVSQSPYSIFLGVPVPVWGIVGYGFFLILLMFSGLPDAQRKRLWTLLFLISICFTIFSLFLAFISAYMIKSYCIMCILSQAVNLFLLYFTWLVRNRFRCEPFTEAIELDIRYLLMYPKMMIGTASVFGVGTVLMLLLFPVYWQITPPVPSKNVPSGFTEDGFPWIGAENPELVIEEFSDYLCFQCKKTHFFLRRLIERHPEKIRLVHRHFPMDHTINPIVKQPFHPGAAKLAVVSLFAAEKGKFWQMNDILFNIDEKTKTVNINELATRTDIDLEEMKHVFKNRNLWIKMQKDIKDGLRYGLTGTPGYVIDKKIYIGQIPQEVLKRYIR